jgi:hypothetical protein
LSRPDDRRPRCRFIEGAAAGVIPIRCLATIVLRGNAFWIGRGLTEYSRPVPSLTERRCRICPGYHPRTVASSDHLPRGATPAPSPNFGLWITSRRCRTALLALAP